MSAARDAPQPRRRTVKQVPWLLAFPGLAALLAFHFVPILFGGYYAFTNWNGLTHARWIGLRTFAGCSLTGSRVGRSGSRSNSRPAWARFFDLAIR